MAKFKFGLSNWNLDKNRILELLPLAIPFILMDFFIRFLAADVSYNMLAIIIPNILFTALWIVVIVAVTVLFGTKLGRIVYVLIFLLYFILFLAHSVYFPYSGFFFSFNLLRSIEEGSAYVWDTIKQAGLLTYINCIIIIASGVFALIKFPKNEKFQGKPLVAVLAIFAVCHLVIPVFLGQKNDDLKWDTWRNPRNIYDSFSDSNKSIKICGLFEYSMRDFYVSFLRPSVKADPLEIVFLEESYSEVTPHVKNDYTGIFSGKNVIFLQLEGIDSWLMNPEDMPNLYSMLDNSFVFENHYSYYNGGGSTFNSELAAVTGFLAPMSYTKNAYSFHTNRFPGSLPQKLSELGYNCNAFHMNNGEYYMRNANYLNWGFENYYSLIETTDYNDGMYQLDRELIQNEFFYEKMFLSGEPFLHYIITYTPHTPFSLDGKTGKTLASVLFENGEAIPEMDEEQVARLFAAETDKMIGLLLEALEVNGLADNTVIVAYADHYLYTLNDKSILDKYKTTSNNLINNTPFIIWSKDIQKTVIEKVNSQLDILPTVFNMLGVEFYDEYYIGYDIMDNNYGGYVFFSDYSWYDGVNYVESGHVTNNQEVDLQYIEDTNNRINNDIRRNDLTLKYDYFKTILKKQEAVSDIE